MKNQGVVSNEVQDRGVIETDRCINSSSEGVGEEGYDTSTKVAVRSEIIQRAEFIRGSRNESNITERYGYIYLTENLINHKLYIGQHKFPGLCSDGIDKTYKGSGQILMRAISKYGKENFKCYLLENCYSKDMLNEREIFWVNEYCATHSNLFYNVASGGHGSPWEGKSNSELKDIKQRISKTLKKYFETHDVPNKGIPMSDEDKKKLSIKLSGSNNPNYGKPRDPETRRKISESHKGKKLSPEQIERMRKALTGRKVSEESRRKQSIRNSGSGNPFYGKHHTEESIYKIRKNMPDMHGANNKFYGKHHTKEVIEICRKVNLGRKMERDVMRFRNIPIRCIETGDIYKSATYLVKNLLGFDINRDMLLRWQRRLKESAKFTYETGELFNKEVFGYHWCYTGEREVK